MLVFAIDIKEKVEKDTAWYCEKNHKYFSSEKGYKAWKKKKENEKYQANQKEKSKILSEQEKEYEKKCRDKFYDWFNYDKSSPKPTIFFSRMKYWHETNCCLYEVIYLTMELVDNDVLKILKNRNFDKESQKVAYICGVINNSLIDGQKLYDRRQQAIAEAQQQTINEHTPTQEEIEMAWVQHKSDDAEHREMVNETLKDILGDDWQ